MTEIEAKPIAHAWSKDALLAKAQLYAEQMIATPRDDWQYAFWSSLALELLARAALANVSPVLLADQTSWHNVYYALGHTPTTSKFVPRSVGVSTVFTRLKAIIPTFLPSMEAFAVVHMSRRNEELHSGETAFDAVATAVWLPSYFETCDVLLQSLGFALDNLFGPGEAAV